MSSSAKPNFTFDRHQILLGAIMDVPLQTATLLILRCDQQWAGFTIGYHIVRDYSARHPGTAAASLVHVDASVILAGSGYAS